MAMYITVKNSDAASENTVHSWHIGEVPDLPDSCEVVEVLADGDELYYVIRAMKNVPHNPNKRVNMWKGDIAQFIVDNI